MWGLITSTATEDVNVLGDRILLPNCPPLGVRRDCTVKLVDDLAGESPASADCPVGTVDISGDKAGD